MRVLYKLAGPVGHSGSEARGQVDARPAEMWTSWPTSAARLAKVRSARSRVGRFHWNSTIHRHAPTRGDPNDLEDHHDPSQHLAGRTRPHPADGRHDHPLLSAWRPLPGDVLLGRLNASRPWIRACSGQGVAHLTERRKVRLRPLVLERERPARQLHADMIRPVDVHHLTVMQRHSMPYSPAARDDYRDTREHVLQHHVGDRCTTEDV